MGKPFGPIQEGLWHKRNFRGSKQENNVNAELQRQYLCLVSACDGTLVRNGLPFWTNDTWNNVTLTSGYIRDEYICNIRWIYLFYATLRLSTPHIRYIVPPPKKNQLHLIVNLSLGSFTVFLIHSVTFSLSSTRTAPLKYTKCNTKDCGSHSVIDFRMEPFYCTFFPSNEENKYRIFR